MGRCKIVWIPRDSHERVSLETAQNQNASVSIKSPSFPKATQTFFTGCATLERRGTQQYRTTQAADMHHYPRRRITITAFVLLGLGFALLRLPLDQKSYASESANFLRVDKVEHGGNAKLPPKGGMVRLSEVKAVPVNHNGSEATKQVQ